MPMRTSPNIERPILIMPNYLKYPEGSCLVRFGHTHVICAASVDTRVKEWLRGKGRGWVTAEYAMLPRANATRSMREGQFGKWPSSRSQEIQRLIGRCLRSAVWLEHLGEITITIDCDVIQADGGTRTAAITGGWVALALALHKLSAAGKIRKPPLKSHIAAISTGWVNGEVLLDLNYQEDVNADVDLNLAADEHGNIAEVQGTAEGRTFSASLMHDMTALALTGIQRLVRIQAETLRSVGIDPTAFISPPPAYGATK